MTRTEWHTADDCLVMKYKVTSFLPHSAATTPHNTKTPSTTQNPAITHPMVMAGQTVVILSLDSQCLVLVDPHMHDNLQMQFKYNK